MNYLSENNCSVYAVAESGGKIIGICLGMQLLLTESDESPGVQGLSIIEGKCSRLLPTSSFAVPHIGWNSLVFNPQCTDALSFIHNDKISSSESKDFYFVHSFVARTSSNYHQMFYFEHPDFRQTAGVCKGNVVGFQFHPEKSGPSGYALLNQFIK